MSMEGLPRRSVYWVAIWPPLMSFWSISSVATNRPSPWDTGMLCRSPTLQCSIQGDFTEATRVVV